MVAGSRLHLIGGATVDVDQTPEDSARLLGAQRGATTRTTWGTAALQRDAKPILVNPQAVAYVERRPDKGMVAG